MHGNRVPQPQHTPPSEKRPFSLIAVGGIFAILIPMWSYQKLRTFALHVPAGIFSGLFCLLLVCPGMAHAAKPFTAPITPLREKTPVPSAKPVTSYTVAERGDTFRVSITYPHIDVPVADAELAIWAREQANAFIDSIRLIPTPPPLPYELAITYETVTASSSVVSVVFFISTTMGGTQPEPGMATFVYDKRNGRRLSYNDILMQRDGLPLVFSRICRRTLEEQLGDKTDIPMLDAGTAPDMSNFDLFSLTPDGVRIYFPPYQVAPYSAGYLNVTIPLTDLTAFTPHKDFWDLP